MSHCPPAVAARHVARQPCHTWLVGQRKVVSVPAWYHCRPTETICIQAMQCQLRLQQGRCAGHSAPMLQCIGSHLAEPCAIPERAVAALPEGACAGCASLLEGVTLCATCCASDMAPSQNKAAAITRAPSLWTALSGPPPPGVVFGDYLSRIRPGLSGLCACSCHRVPCGPLHGVLVPCAARRGQLCSGGLPSLPPPPQIASCRYAAVSPQPIMDMTT